MNVRQANKSLVAKLRVTGDTLEAVSTRLNFERLFGADDFLPSCLPSKSIVCIKKISDPKPQTLRLNQSDLRVSEIWRKAVSRQIENFYRRAFRPIREIVPAQAESIIFADNTELLVCLASDWCRGKLAENWWWRGLFPNLGYAQTVAGIWLDSAEFVPTAFQTLSKTGGIIQFAQKLQPHEAKDLLKRIIRSFGLQKLDEALFEPTQKKTAFEIEKSLKADAKKAFSFKSGSSVFKKPESIFSALIPDVNVSELSFERQCLLGISLLLARSPKIVRSANFAQSLKLYRTKNEPGKTIAGKDFFKEVFEQGAAIERRVETRQKTTRNAPGKSEIQTDLPKSVKTESRVLSEQPDKKAEKLSEKTKLKFNESSEIAEQTGIEAETLKETKEKRTKLSFETAQSEKIVEKIEQKEAEKDGKSREVIKPADLDSAFQELFEDFETETEFSFQTRFGGIFYLFNLGLYLQLYRDFTESLEAEIDLNIWDFLALLGLEFLGGELKTDGVWDFLKTMAQRENDGEFAQEFDEFQDWRMPLEWLATFPKNQNWFFGKKGKRLVIRHSAGFNVVDVLRRGDFEAQMQNELEIYQKYFSGITKAEKRELSQIKAKKWLKNLAEYLQKRLFQALNLQTSEELNAILFKCKAMVTTSATHLEITFGLADLPVEVRLAGIDRDPGWIPAAGKFVYFHFA